MDDKTLAIQAQINRMDDNTLAIQAQRGCMDSFEELLRRHQVPLLHFLQRFSNKTDAEDILQDTFIRAYQNLDRYQPSWQFSTWLFTIARRLAANSRRRQRPRGDDLATIETPQIDPPDTGSLEPSESLAAEEDKRKLWEIAGSVLTEDQHTAVWLYYVEDMPVKDIATVLGRFVPATEMILHRARQKLMPALQATDFNHD